MTRETAYMPIKEVEVKRILDGREKVILTIVGPACEVTVEMDDNDVSAIFAQWSLIDPNLPAEEDKEGDDLEAWEDEDDLRVLTMATIAAGGHLETKDEAGPKNEAEGEKIRLKDLSFDILSAESTDNQPLKPGRRTVALMIRMALRQLYQQGNGHF